MEKIMLVEDDATMLSLLRTLLQMEGFEVVLGKTDSVDVILANLEGEKPILALVDVHLRQANGSEISGFEVLKRVRMSPVIQNMFVLMSSGIDLHEECIQAGANGFLLKPYMPDELIKRIRDAIKADAV